MNNVDRMLYWFRNKRRATLGDINRSGEKWAYEFRARKTELNSQGGPQIVLAERNAKNPSMNVYELREANDGQYGFAI